MYKYWNVSNHSIRAWRRNPPKYIHHCPLIDFQYLYQQVLNVLEKEDTFSKIDLYNRLEGKKLPNGSIFSKEAQDYKISIFVDVMEVSEMIEKVGLKKIKNGKGRQPYAYRLAQSKNHIDIWIHKLLQ